MRSFLVLGLVGGLAAGVAYFTLERPLADDPAPGRVVLADAANAASSPAIAADRIAGLPDRGMLLEFASQASPIRRGAYTMHAVALSEEHALASIETGRMTVRTPKGAPVQLDFDQKIEHADGNWTWVGHPAGGKPGIQAIITFGDKAVFGTIPQPSGGALELVSAKGRTWMVETDASRVPKQGPDREADAIAAPAAVAGVSSRLLDEALATIGIGSAQAAAPIRAGAQRLISAEAVPVAAATTIDLVAGYTTTFANRLGGASQAVTRLNFLVDLANTAFGNTQAGGQVRLISTVQVNFADASSNRTVLQQLSGVTCAAAAGPTRTEFPDDSVTCTAAAVPAALQPLVSARERFGADLVTLVRTFQDPEQQSCGIGWMLGGGRQALDASSAPFGYSVVSDSNGSGNPDPDTGNTCRSEQLAHEIGHNLGLQHEIEVAQETSDQDGDGSPLDAEEYGRHTYSFGYQEPVTSGDFYTLMAQRRAGADNFLVFSNPRITFCGGRPCGNDAQADQARTISQSLPIVAAFRLPVMAPQAAWLRGDFNGDGTSDIFWRHLSAGVNAIWLSANSATPQSAATVGDQAWVAVGAADFNGDARSDILWRHNRTGQNVIWRSGVSTASQAVTTVASPSWYVAGVGDFDGDARADILWRNASNGQNAIWRSANSAASINSGFVTDQTWAVVGVGDFNGDNRADILWRNGVTGANMIWRSGLASQSQGVTTVATAWVAAGVADFDGDGRDDILWRHSATGQNAIWRSANSATPQAVTTVADPAWVVVAVGDFNRDGRADIMWRNGRTGGNAIWRSANSATPQGVTAVANLNWVVSS